MAQFDDAKLEELQAAHKNGIVMGLHTVAGIVPRLDIDVLLHKHPKTFNLFTLALDDLQRDTNFRDRMGYFQMAGIHGAPKALWDDMGSKINKNFGVDKSSQDPSGYCHHYVETFPTWHRPYLAMMEQALYLKMIEIAKKYNAEYQNDYLNAAQRFRLPFGTIIGHVEVASSFPVVLTEKTLSVRIHPQNELKQLPHNPFRFYEFQPGSFPDAEWKIFADDPYLFPRNRTVRHRKPNRKEIEEDHDRLNSVINQLRMDNNRLVLTMMEDNIYDNFEVFATNSDIKRYPHEPVSTKKASEKVWKPHADGRASGSLEALHGLYHLMVGGDPLQNKGIGGGHMSRVPLAAFDPVFWLHYCQIDRLFAIWQAIHKDKPDNWISRDQIAKEGLMPFRKTNGNQLTDCWTSEQSRECDPFGYTYSEISGKARDVFDRFREMYEWSVPLSSSGDFGEIPDEMRPADLSNSEFFKVPAPSTETTSLLLSSMQASAPMKAAVIMQSNPPASINSVTDKELEFSRKCYIDDEVQRLSLSGAFTIYYFVMNTAFSLPADADLVMQPSLAGVTHIFAAPRQACDNCANQQQQSVKVTNTVPITSLLLDYVRKGQLQSLEPEHVTPFLEKGLKWRIVSVNAKLEDPRFMAAEKGFQLNISCKVARLPRHSGDVMYEEYPEVIQRIIGGASETPTS